MSGRKLPRRDSYLIPLLSLSTIIVLFAAAMAQNVPLEQAWGERTARDRLDATARKVEVENLGWELLNRCLATASWGKWLP